MGATIVVMDEDECMRDPLRLHLQALVTLRTDAQPRAKPLRLEQLLRTVAKQLETS